MRKGKLLGIILMKAFRIRTGKYDEESGIFPGFPTEETAVQNMISIMELHWRIWNPESNYNFEEKTFRLISVVGQEHFSLGKRRLPPSTMNDFRI